MKCPSGNHYPQYLITSYSKKRKIMEGSQRLIGQSTLSTLMIDESSLPEDHLRLRINSNDTYSRQFHNCYSFAIEFDQPAEEALHYRINQCNRYQIISVTTPIRSTLGMLHSPDAIVKLTAQVVKMFSTTSSSINDNNGTGDFKSSFGLLSHQAFHSLHEDLALLHVSIWCDSLTEQPSNSIYDRVYTKSSPHNIKVSPVITSITKNDLILNSTPENRL